MQLENINCILCGRAELSILQEPKPVGLVECVRCGLIFLNPSPVRDEHYKFHHSRYFIKYYGETVEQFYQRKGELYRRIKSLNQSRLGFVQRYAEQGKLLDVGAGQGMFITLARQAGFQTVATDVMRDVAAYFRSNGFDYKDGYIEDMELPPDSFGAVTMWHSLEHILNPCRTLTEIKRTLKNKGYLFIAVPNFDSIIEQLKLLLNRPFLSGASTEIHYFYFTERTLKELLHKSGFRIIHCRADIRDFLKSSWRAKLGLTVNGMGAVAWPLMGKSHYTSLLCVAQKG